MEPEVLTARAQRWSDSGAAYRTPRASAPSSAARLAPLIRECDSRDTIVGPILALVAVILLATVFGSF